MASLARNNEERGKWQIEIVSAKALPKMDVFGSCDAYAVLNIGQTQHKTNIEKSLSPEWRQSFTVDASANVNTAQVSVYDWDRIGTDDLVGKTAPFPLVAGDKSEHLLWNSTGDTQHGVVVVSIDPIKGAASHAAHADDVQSSQEKSDTNETPPPDPVDPQSDCCTTGQEKDDAGPAASGENGHPDFMQGTTPTNTDTSAQVDGRIAGATEILALERKQKAKAKSVENTAYFLETLSLPNDVPEPAQEVPALTRPESADASPRYASTQHCDWMQASTGDKIRTAEFTDASLLAAAIRLDDAPQTALLLRPLLGNDVRAGISCLKRAVDILNGRQRQTKTQRKHHQRDVTSVEILNSLCTLRTHRMPDQGTWASPALQLLQRDDETRPTTSPALSRRSDDLLRTRVQWALGDHRPHTAIKAAKAQVESSRPYGRSDSGSSFFFPQGLPPPSDPFAPLLDDIEGAMISLDEQARLRSGTGFVSSLQRDVAHNKLAQAEQLELRAKEVRAGIVQTGLTAASARQDIEDAHRLTAALDSETAAATVPSSAVSLSAAERSVLDQTNAAATEQSLTAGVSSFLETRAIGGIRSAILSGDWTRAREMAATLLQSVWRAKLASRRIGLRREDLLRAERQNACVRTAQCAWRRAVSRKRVARLRRERDGLLHKGAATIIQCFWRIYAARRNVKQLFALRLGTLRDASATIIQCCARSYLARLLSRDLARAKSDLLKEKAWVEAQKAMVAEEQSEEMHELLVDSHQRKSLSDKMELIEIAKKRNNREVRDEIVPFYVRLVAAEGLREADGSKGSDPFVWMTVSTHSGEQVGLAKSQTVNGTVNPAFEEDLLVRGVEHNSTLRFTVCDWDKFSKNDFLGQAHMKLEELGDIWHHARPVEKTLQLRDFMTHVNDANGNAVKLGDTGCIGQGQLTVVIKPLVSATSACGWFEALQMKRKSLRFRSRRDWHHKWLVLDGETLQLFDDRGGTAPAAVGHAIALGDVVSVEIEAKREDRETVLRINPRTGTPVFIRSLKSDHETRELLQKLRHATSIGNT